NVSPAGQPGSPVTLQDPIGKGVWSAVFSAQGTLATGDYAGDIYLWNIATQSPVGPLVMPGSVYNPVTALAFSADGSLLASADKDGSTYLWNVATQSHQPIYTSAIVWSLTFSPAGTLAMAAGNGHAYLWRVSAGSLTAVVTGTLTDPHSGTAGVDTAAFSNDGSWLATGDSNGSTYLWKAAG
ncbi:MAG TPA: hypothetical protein VN840_09510, partial [Streptosporangiaceae bacterium]|nr:hypothetical protein [Streptosporangiaceae bacterium]